MRLFYNPVNIISGQNSLLKLKNLVTEGNYLLITSNSFTKRGFTQKIITNLASSKLTIYDQVSPNPDILDLNNLLDTYKDKQFKGVIGLGGGSVLDTAKVLAISLLNGLQLNTENLKQRLALILIPTTAGTGSEVTPFATIWDHKTYKKHSLSGDLVFADHAILDPELTLTVPKNTTLYAGLDTISHALESLWNVNRNIISESFAIKALDLAKLNLPKVLEEPSNLTFRQGMQEASLLAGLAISHTKTAIAHSMSYPLTAHFNMPHGLACSFTLPKIIEHYLDSKEGLEKQLLIEIKELLKSLELNKLLLSYASKEQILACLPEMSHPDRLKNYSPKLNVADMKEFLN